MDEKNNNISEITLDEKTRERYKNLLVSVYGVDLNKVNQMNDSELQNMLVIEQENSIRNSKNPNKFWIFKDLPAPKKQKTTTSTKAGWIIFIVFVVLLLIVGIVFLILGLSNHNII